jgi:DNA polymerase III epsilon subunit-like protein
MPMKADYLFPRRNVSIVALDLELTGLNRERDRIIQYGLAGNQIPGGWLGWVVDPESNTGRDMSRIPGVSAADVANAKPLADHLDLLRLYLTNAIVVMHKSNHDWFFIEKEFRRLGEEPPVPQRMVCTLQLTKHILKLPGIHTLRALCSGFNISLENKGNAKHDALATYMLFVILVNRFWDSYFGTFYQYEFEWCSKYFPREDWLSRARLTTLKH